MKTIIASIIVVCAFLLPVKAQKIIEKHLDYSNGKSIVMDLSIADSIIIHTWNKKEVYAKASVNINDNADNDAYLTSFDNNADQVNISAEFKKGYFSGRNNCMRSDIYWNVYIPENTDFSVKTINGNIIIDGNTAAIESHSISGFVDVTVPPGKKADLEMKTVTGTIYSNYDFEQKSRGYVSSRVAGNMNGGGEDVDLASVSGDIFFRVRK